MKDYEVHPIGTFNEIKYSRELANAIEQITEQYGKGIVPESVLKPYLKLKQHHQLMISEEELIHD